MSTKFLVRTLSVVALFLSSLAIAQQDFSADIVNNKQDRMSTPGRIYLTKDKMRFESHDQAAEHFGAMIMNLNTRTTDVLIPERKMYIESSATMGPATQRTWNFFRPADIDNACADWIKLANKPGGTCRKVGSETVNGRNTIKYEGTSADGQPSTVWLDTKLDFPIKWQQTNSSGELQNIKEGSQPASLFEIPAGYQKMEMPMGMPQNMPRH